MISTGCSLPCRREPLGRLPLRGCSLLDRRARARCDRVPLLCLPGGRRRAVGRVCRPSPRPRRRGRGGPRLGAGRSRTTTRAGGAAARAAPACSGMRPGGRPSRSPPRRSRTVRQGSRSRPTSGSRRASGKLSGRPGYRSRRKGCRRPSRCGGGRTPDDRLKPVACWRQGRPSSPAIGCRAATTFAMCWSSSSPSSSAPA